MTGRVRYSNVNAPVTKVHDNTSQEIIIITSDRLELVLERYLKNLERRKEWIAPLSLLITVVVTFSTATFKQAFFSADTWSAIFFLVGLLSLLWLIKSSLASWKAPAIGDLMSKIKQNSESQSNTQLQRAGNLDSSDKA